MSPPLLTVDISSTCNPLPSDLDDDSRLCFESLLSLCKKTLAEADFLTSAMRSCICEGESALKADLFGDFFSDLETPLSPSIYDDSVLPPLPDSLLDESVVPETQFALDMIVPETEGFEGCNWSRKRKAGDAWKGPATAETAAAKAVEIDTCGEEMLRILLPAYFRLVRSFP